MDIIQYIPRWKSFLSENSEILDDILITIDSSSQKIRPDRSEVLSIYSIVPPKDIRVVMMGQSPYPDDNACGIPFVSKRRSNPKTLQVLCEEIELEYGKIANEPNLMVEEWVKQGVFIINASPTIGFGSGKEYTHDHSILWKEFMINLVRYICTKKVPLLLFGKEAWDFEQFTSSELVLKVPHPVSRGDKKFVGCMVFSNVNKYFESENLDLIKWI